MTAPRELNNCHLPPLPGSRPRQELYNRKNYIAHAAICHARKFWLYAPKPKFLSCRHWLQAWNAIPVYPDTGEIHRLFTTLSADRNNPFASGTAA